MVAVINSSALSQSFEMLYTLSPRRAKFTHPLGRGIRLGLENLSYYPITLLRWEREQRDVRSEMTEKELQERQERFEAIQQILRGRIKHEDAKGELIVRNYEGQPGFIECIMSITYLRNPEKLTTISSYSLNPHTHRVKSIGNIGHRCPYGATFYTEEDDGSEWSIHAWNPAPIKRLIRP